MKCFAILTAFLAVFFCATAQKTTSSSLYKITTPESVGISSSRLNKAIAAIADSAIRAHAIPGCQVLVARKGQVVYYKTFGYFNYDSLERVTRATVYDLASVTKVSATTVSIMKLFEQKKLDLHATLGTYIPWVRGSDKDTLHIDDILLHQAGLLPDVFFHRETIDSTGRPLPYFFRAIRDSLYSVRVADNLFLRKDWLDTMNLRIVQSPLLLPVKYVYSDLDFIFLGKIVEQLSGKTLNNYVADNFYKPLGMHTTTFIPKEKGISIARIAPTEKEDVFRLELLRGDVHDPSAAMYGGVAGHAGLFSNAYDLAKLYLMLLNGGNWNGHHFLNRQTINLFTGYHSSISRRAYGFDKPMQDNATNGDPYPSIYASPETFGHTGFTGTCVWADPKEDLLFIMLSNRVCPFGGANNLLSTLDVRRNMLDAVYKAIDKKKEVGKKLTVIR
jgi:beta-N-acetylhexosaminidase